MRRPSQWGLDTLSSEGTVQPGNESPLTSEECDPPFLQRPDPHTSSVQISLY